MQICPARLTRDSLKTIIFPESEAHNLGVFHPSYIDHRKKKIKWCVKNTSNTTMKVTIMSKELDDCFTVNDTIFFPRYKKMPLPNSWFNFLYVWCFETSNVVFNNLKLKTFFTCCWKRDKANLRLVYFMARCAISQKL